MRDLVEPCIGEAVRELWESWLHWPKEWIDQRNIKVDNDHFSPQADFVHKNDPSWKMLWIGDETTPQHVVEALQVQDQLKQQVITHKDSFCYICSQGKPHLGIPAYSCAAHYP